MTDLPPDPDKDPESEPGSADPFSAAFGAMDPAQLGAAFQQLGRILASGESGPVNWDLGKDLARQTVAARGDSSVGDAQRRAVVEALRLADVWLDAVTTVPAGATSLEVWSRAEWVEATIPTWRLLVEPVAARVAVAMDGVVPEEMRQMAGPLLGIMRQMGGAMFGGQVGQAIGQLATEVLGSTDIGLPLGPAGTAALLPANAAAFGEGLGVSEDQVVLYLALRETAHHRLFSHVPWLRGYLVGAVEDYARGITVDTGRFEGAMARLDPTNPEAMQEALSGGLFDIEQTPAQQAALARLETALALVEGWVDEVVSEAASTHLPTAAALRETVRRRRAVGGPAEQTFSTLVGLELRPRRLREAAALWHALYEARGMDGRDAVWGHPDLLPTADDLADPAGYVDRAGRDWSIADLPEVSGDDPGAPPADNA